MTSHHRCKRCQLWGAYGTLFETAGNKRGFALNLAQVAANNEAYRRVLYTSVGMQFVAMRLQPGAEVGSEVHARTSQVFFAIDADDGSENILVDIETPEGTISRAVLQDGDALVVPAGVRHNVRNTHDKQPARFVTLYIGDVLHADGLVEQ
jgi:mannose-6-phosphate isomerase-like protein (cupin superfamily)